jgi:hypothetical protein
VGPSVDQIGAGVSSKVVAPRASDEAIPFSIRGDDVPASAGDDAIAEGRPRNELALLVAVVHVRAPAL